MARTRKSADKKTFEETLHRLEEIVEQLERGNISLEDSLKMYEEGLSLSKQCMEKLNHAETRLKVLAKNVLGDFDLQEGTADV